LDHPWRAPECTRARQTECRSCIRQNADTQTDNQPKLAPIIPKSRLIYAKPFRPSHATLNAPPSRRPLTPSRPRLWRELAASEKPQGHPSIVADPPWDDLGIFGHVLRAKSPGCLANLQPRSIPVRRFGHFWSRFVGQVAPSLGRAQHRRNCWDDLDTFDHVLRDPGAEPFDRTQTRWHMLPHFGDDPSINCSKSAHPQNGPSLRTRTTWFRN
jgi:hypothetical protein